MLFSLAVGEVPKLVHGEGLFRSAASFIFRRFQKPLKQHILSKAELAQVLAPYPDAKIMLYYKTGSSLDREIRWLGSYRYAVLNLGGLSRGDLFDRFNQICKKLHFEDCHYSAQEP
jgi:hypothetical protein